MPVVKRIILIYHFNKCYDKSRFNSSIWNSYYVVFIGTREFKRKMKINKDDLLKYYFREVFGVIIINMGQNQYYVKYRCLYDIQTKHEIVLN